LIRPGDSPFGKRFLPPSGTLGRRGPEEEGPLATIEADIRTAREPGRAERREHERHPAGWHGRVTVGTLSCPCVVIDLSVGGAQLALAAGVQIKPWTVVTLHIESLGAFHGRVVWVRGDRHGLQFLDAARAALRRVAQAQDGGG
jgi:hypothetical protein